MKHFCRGIFAGIVFSLTLMAPSLSQAIPAFSREYRTSCVTCHEAFPKRNAAGDAFRLNGFRFKDDESYRKQEPVEMGDEAYKRLWPKAVWPSSIPARVPISLITRWMMEVDMDGSRDDSVLFLFPEELEAVWAQKIGETISLYGDIIFISKDFGIGVVESWATLKAWIQFQSLFGPNNLFNLKVGTVGTNGMALYTARDANNFTTHFYLYSTWTMPKVNLAASGLNDFEGNPFSLQPLAGVEANGVGKRWTYTLGLVDFPQTDIYFVGVSEKAPEDLFFQFAYKFGGMNMDGPDADNENPLAARPEFWRDDHLMFSLFGYVGNAEIRTEDAAGVVRTNDDEYWRLGVGIQGKYKDLTVGGGYMWGDNDNPYGDLSSASVESGAWFAEAYFFGLPWLIPYARYEGLNLDLPSGVAGLNPAQDNARIIVGGKAMIRANVALNIEGTVYTQGEELNEGIDRTLFVLLSAAF